MYSPHTSTSLSNEGCYSSPRMKEDGKEDIPSGQCSILCGPRSCATLPSTLSSDTSPDGSASKGRRKMFGWKGLVKLFRRKVRRVSSSGGREVDSPINEGLLKKHSGGIRTRSASELLRDSTNRSSIGLNFNQGISVSHDSVFSPDSSPSDPPSHNSPHSQPITSAGVSMSELKAVLRHRVNSGGKHSTPMRRQKGGDDSGDDDLGLPLSPPISPTTVDVFSRDMKSVSRATHSTCSDASLLSMGSSELEEDSAASLTSSKHSLGDIRSLQVVVDNEPVAGEAPGLSHNAARHKMAVRPRRTHERSRQRRPMQQVQSSSFLPTTVEVSEEAAAASIAPIRSLSASHITKPTSFDPLNHHPDPYHDFALRSSRASHHANISSSSVDKEASETRTEEPLLIRLFDSVRSGRRRSRSRHDSDENISPLRLDTGSVDNPPLVAKIGRTNSRGKERSRRKYSDLHLQDEYRQNQIYMPMKSSSVERKQLHDNNSEVEKRAVSVQVKIDSQLEPSTSPLRVQISPYKDRTNLSSDHRHSAYIDIDGKQRNVKKAKSFKEIGKPSVVVRKEQSRRSWFEVGSHNDSSVESRIKHSTSYDCLDTNSLLVSQVQRPTVVHLDDMEQNKSAENIVSPTISFNMSSTDSLTTTEIPGVYIRSISQCKNTVVPETIDGTNYWKQNSIPTENIQSSGPLSLDSSISYTPLNDAQIIRKTSSSDHVLTSNVIYVKPSFSSYHEKPAMLIHSMSYPITSSLVTQENKPHYAVSSTVTDIQSGDDSPLLKLNAPGPASVLRSISLSTSDSSGSYVVLSKRAVSIDELEQNDGTNNEEELEQAQIKPRLRQKDSCPSRHDSLEPTEPMVPEFMRIQLNKVDNKPQRVKYATEQEESSLVDTDSTLEMEGDVHCSSETVSIDLKDISVETQYKQNNDSTRREDTISNGSQNSQPNNDAESGDEVVLRRSLKREKSLIVETACEIVEQSELMKVFAKRSFKTKDKFTTAPSDEEIDRINRDIVNEDVCSNELMPHVIGVTKINPLYSTPTLPITQILSSNVQSKFSTIAPHPSTPFPSDSNGEINAGSFVGKMPAKFAMVNNKSSPTSMHKSHTPELLRSRNNSSSPINKLIGATQLEFNNLDIRPIFISKENEEATLSSSQKNNFDSSIINRAQKQINSQLTNENLKKPGSEQCDEDTQKIVTSAVWPLKNSVKSNIFKSSPCDNRGVIASRVEESNLEVSKSDTCESHIPSDDDLSQVQSVRKKFMTTSSKPIVSTSGRHPLVIEARNIAPAFTITVRNNARPSSTYIGASRSRSTVGSNSKIASKGGVITPHHRHSIGGFYVPPSRQQISHDSSSPPPPSFRRSSSHIEGTQELNSSIVQTNALRQTRENNETSEDWRVLARQRREDRLKHTKSIETVEQTVDTRGNSRNSKVLEMANNFQKLQVA